ncbi:hypothetical protein HT748_03050 [Burkholderia cepacia]|nr:hypothetical protein [Burkholderia cepacia]NTX18497.1 hypothetical protein [Burkholderia cepacia]
MRPSYPAVWGSCRIVTGPLSDCWGSKGLIVAGMRAGRRACAGRADGAVALMADGWRLVASVLPGLGTAMVCPGLIAAVSDASDASDASGPGWRARSLAERVSVLMRSRLCNPRVAGSLDGRPIRLRRSDPRGGRGDFRVWETSSRL